MLGTGFPANDTADKTTLGQGARLYLPVTVTQSYNSLIPNLGVLVNSLIFFININRLCLKDKVFRGYRLWTETVQLEWNLYLNDTDNMTYLLEFHASLTGYSVTTVASNTFASIKKNPTR